MASPFDKEFNVGDTFVYPGGDWTWLVEVPDDVAIAWAAKVAPDSVLGSFKTHTASELRLASRARQIACRELADLVEGYRWLNKLAVVVEVDRGTLALYKHDFATWLIKRNENNALLERARKAEDDALQWKQRSQRAS